MSENGITPIGVATSGLAGAAVGAAVPPTASWVAQKLKGGKIDTFVRAGASRVSKAFGDIKTGFSQAGKDFFTSSAKATTDAATTPTGIKGFLITAKNKAAAALHYVGSKLKPLYSKAKQPRVLLPMLGALAGVLIYIASKRKNDVE